MYPTNRRRTLAFLSALTVAGFLHCVALLHTQAGQVETHRFDELARVIPDGNPAGLSDVRVIASSIANLSKLRVGLTIDGEYNGDLYVYLRQVVDGSTNFVVLLNRPGRSADNAFGYEDPGIDVVFDDLADHDIHLYREHIELADGQPLTGSWQPDCRNVDPDFVLDSSVRSTSLTTFLGHPAAGEWTLFVADLHSGATQVLVAWELEFHGPTEPPVDWPTPTDIVYGTALDATQLKASSTVPGSFQYDPPAGTILNAGTDQPLTMTFTPDDTDHYVSVSRSVPLNVLPKDLIVTARSFAKVYGAPLPSFTVDFDGFIAGDTPDHLDSPPTITTTATSASDAGSYPIVPAGTVAANYLVTHVPGTLTVTPADSGAVLVSSTNPALPGEPVTFTVSLTAIPPGAGIPTGHVVLEFGDDVGAQEIPLIDGVASFVISSLPVGWHFVKAQYPGDLNFDPVNVSLDPPQSVNTPPVAHDDSIERHPTNGVKVAVNTLLANDLDADGDELSLMSVDAVSALGGTVTLVDGWIHYTPPAGPAEQDSFTYTITDSRGATATATVIILIASEPPEPTTLRIILDGPDLIRLAFDGIPGRTYIVEYTDSLDLTDWHGLGSVTADEFGYFEYHGSLPSDHPGRFYRVLGGEAAAGDGR